MQMGKRQRINHVTDGNIASGSCVSERRLVSDPEQMLNDVYIACLRREFNYNMRICSTAIVQLSMETLQCSVVTLRHPGGSPAITDGLQCQKMQA